MPRRFRGIARGAPIAAVSLAVFFGTAELVVRGLDLGPPAGQLRWVSDSALQYLPRPDQQTFVGRDDPSAGATPQPIRINRYGQRGADYPLDKANSQYRIVVLGDSLVMGFGVGDEDTLPVRVQRNLDGSTDGTCLPQVVNAGVLGWAPLHYRAWVETRLATFRPDLLVVALYLGNDGIVPASGAQRIGTPPLPVFRDSALLWFAAQQYRRHLWKRVTALRKGVSLAELDGEIARYRGVSDSDFSLDREMALWEANAFPELARIRGRATAENVPVVVLSIPTSSMAGGGPSRVVVPAVRDRVEALGLAHVGCLDELRQAGRDAWLPWDEGHLSPRGNRVVADCLVDELIRSGLACPPPPAKKAEVESQGTGARVPLLPEARTQGR